MNVLIPPEMLAKQEGDMAVERERAETDGRTVYIYGLDLSAPAVLRSALLLVGRIDNGE